MAPKLDLTEKVELPILTALGWERTAQGWVVFRVRVQGNRVIEKTVVDGPDTQMVAKERFKVAVVNNIFHPKADKA